MQLHDFQQLALSNLWAAYRGGAKAPVLVAPTGAGKTVMAATAIDAVTRKGKRTLFLAHRKELIEQASSKLRAVDVKHGIVMAGCIADRRPAVQVASIQTMINRLDMYEPFDLIVIDEAHRSGAKSYDAVCRAYPEARRLGLTATPTRLDGRGLGQDCGGLFDTLVDTVSTAELIARGHLCPYRYFAPDVVDTSGMSTIAGDWDQHEAAARVDKPRLIGSAVKHHADLALGRPTLVFAANLRHAEHIAAEFQAAGRAAVAVSGDTHHDVRRNALLDLAAGRIDVLVNVGLWIEGMDCPPISCVILMALTQSVTRYLQSVGRGLRTHPGKVDCIFLDHANCVHTHGLPCERREWTLDGRKRRPKSVVAEFPVRECPKCYATVRASVTVCHCGHRFAESVHARVIEVEDGRLHEIDAEKLSAARAAKLAQQMQGMSRSREGLVALGYSEGRADHVLAGRLEKQELRRTLSALRRTAGIPVKGIDSLKPKALRAEIESISKRMLA